MIAIETAKRVYGARPIKRNRRDRAAIAAIEQAIYRIVATDHPMTLRGLFYRLVSEGEIGKEASEYKNVGRYLLAMRRRGDLPYHWIADSTRWQRKPRTYSGLDDVLYETARTYRRPIWEEQDAYLEIWIEKDTLAGVLYEEAERWDVPLMVCRGFASETYLHDAAEAIKQQGKPTWLYLMVDHDPSGHGIAAHMERIIRGFLPEGYPVTVDLLAVTPQQIEQWHLPTRPTKKTDSRSKGFVGESVELDAIPPATLRAIVRDAIERHIDPDALARTRQVEHLERETLYEIQEQWGGAA